MKPMLNSMSLAIAALLATTLPGYAAGPYDGTWVADAPAAGGVGAGTEVPTGCQAVRIPFKVTDNRISGNLERSTYGTGRVQPSPTGQGSPITGTVQPDGTFNAQWQNYRATGRFAGNKVEIHWSGECGQRVATGTRVATAGEAKGSTTAPRAAARGGRFDGSWVVDAPAAGGVGAGTEVPTGCEAVRIPFTVTGNRVSGSLERSTYGTGRVQSGEGRRAAPITGTVAPDGTVNAQWQNYHATGKLVGDRAELRWNGECGQRVATGTRVAAAGEGAGATVPPQAVNPAAPYDGTWVVDVPAAGGVGAGTEVPTGCQALRLPFRVVNNQVVGSLERSTYGTGRVQPGQGPRAAPVTGTVAPDGTVNAQWQNYHVTGKLTGNKATLRWRGECGERVATGGRVAATGESTGSSTEAPSGTVGSPPPGTAYTIPQGNAPQGVHH
jgi:hypothetical protein